MNEETGFITTLLLACAIILNALGDSKQGDKITTLQEQLVETTKELKLLKEGL